MNNYINLSEKHLFMLLSVKTNIIWIYAAARCTNISAEKHGRLISRLQKMIIADGQSKARHICWIPGFAISLCHINPDWKNACSIIFGCSGSLEREKEVHVIKIKKILDKKRTTAIMMCANGVIHCADIAQLAERPPCKRQVIGSSPIVGSVAGLLVSLKRFKDANELTTVQKMVSYPSGQRGLTVNQIAEAFGGSNPSLTTDFMREAG